MLQRYFSKYRLTKAMSAAAAQTQLLIRSSQLPTPARNASRTWSLSGVSNSVTRCFECEVPPQRANERHFFVSCLGITAILAEETVAMRKVVADFMATKGKLPPIVVQNHMRLAEAMFIDHELWLEGKCDYYVGALPKMFDYDTMFTSLYNDLSGHAIRVAARLWYRQVSNR